MNERDDISLSLYRKNLAENIASEVGVSFEEVIEVFNLIDKWADKIMEMPPLPDSKEGVDILPYIQTGK